MAHPYHVEMAPGYMRPIAALALMTLVVLAFPALAWNIPGHMLFGIIAYQVLRQENPPTIEKVKSSA